MKFQACASCHTVNCSCEVFPVYIPRFLRLHYAQGIARFPHRGKCTWDEPRNEDPSVRPCMMISSIDFVLHPLLGPSLAVLSTNILACAAVVARGSSSLRSIPSSTSLPPTTAPTQLQARLVSVNRGCSIAVLMRLIGRCIDINVGFLRREAPAARNASFPARRTTAAIFTTRPTNRTPAIKGTTIFS